MQFLKQIYLSTGNSRPLYVNYQTNAEIQRGLLPDKGIDCLLIFS